MAVLSSSTNPRHPPAQWGSCIHLHTLRRNKDRLHVFLFASHLWVPSSTNAFANLSAVGLISSYHWSKVVSLCLNWTSACLSDNLGVGQHKLQPPFYSFTARLISGQHFFSQVLQVPSLNTHIFLQASSCVLTPAILSFWRITKKLLWATLSSSFHLPLTQSPWHLLSALDKWVFSHSYLFTALLKRLSL